MKKSKKIFLDEGLYQNSCGENGQLMKEKIMNISWKNFIII